MCEPSLRPAGYGGQSKCTVKCKSAYDLSADRRRRSQLLLAFLNAHLTATLTWIRLRDLLERKVAKADCRFQGCLISESDPYGKTSTMHTSSRARWARPGCLREHRKSGRRRRRRLRITRRGNLIVYRSRYPFSHAPKNLGAAPRGKTCNFIKKHKMLWVFSPAYTICHPERSRGISSVCRCVRSFDFASLRSG